MLLFFNPPQSLLQVYLLDPDGAKHYAKLEESIAAQILKERQAKQRPKKKKKLSFKEQIQQRLVAGEVKEQIAQQVDDAALRAEIDQIVADYQKQLQEEIQRRFLIEQEALIAAEIEKIAKEKLKAKRQKALKILLLLVELEDL